MESKSYLLGTHRKSTPQDTLKRVQPLLDGMGISRVANVTGLDRIGIPVYNAFRPQSRSISVSQGKGSEPLAAKVSAIMESVETFHAENIDNAIISASFNALRHSHRLADIENMARAGSKMLDCNEKIDWIEGKNLLDGLDYWLPLELVSTDYTLAGINSSGYFAANTNGLASGNSLKEAICHAIYEVVERDAEALWHQQSARKRALSGVDSDSIDDRNCRALLDKFTAANIEVRIWDLSCDTRFPCFTCLAIGDENDWADPEFGTGCHAAKSVALARALSEAAQARATFIAGSRDDVGLTEYTPKRRRQRRTQGKKQLKSFQATRTYAQIASFENAHIDEDLSLCLEVLKSIDIKQVIQLDLSKAQFGLPVVKAVIPGLEGAFGHWHGAYMQGHRARALLKLPFKLDH